MSVTRVLLAVIILSVVAAVSYVIGRVHQMRRDYYDQLDESLARIHQAQAEWELSEPKEPKVVIWNQRTGRYELSTGREIVAMYGVMGLDAGQSGGTLYHGYDGALWDIEPPLTQREREEIADAMIARWREWRETEPPK
jgi:hypothetical protein